MIENTNNRMAKGFANTIFLIWLLSIPFEYYNVIGTLSVQNILAPISLLLLVATPSYQNAELAKIRIMKMIAPLSLVSLFFVCSLILFVGAKDIFFQRSFALLRISGYFILPILYIKDISFLRKVNSIIVIMTVIGCLSAFLASLGIVEFERTRFEASRIGQEFIPKAIGLFGSYGDLAQLVSFSVLLTILGDKKNILFGFAKRKIKIILIMIIILGLIGTQSRNIVLSSITGVSALIGLHFVFKKENDVISAEKILLLIPFAAFMVILLGFVIHPFIEFVSGLGGKVALANALGRIESYKSAWKLISEIPIFGVHPEIYRRNYFFINSLHNTYLSSLLQSGMLGTLALLALIISPFAKSVRLIGNLEVHKEARVFSAFIISMAVCISFYPGLFSPIFWVMLGIATSFYVMPLGNKA